MKLKQISLAAVEMTLTRSGYIFLLKSVDKFTDLKHKLDDRTRDETTLLSSKSSIINIAGWRLTAILGFFKKKKIPLT